MRDRILALINHVGMTSSVFAEAIGVQRAAISHIIAGRNNPSLDVATKILKRFKKVNPNWLLLGEGEMLTDTANAEPSLLSNDAFLSPDVAKMTEDRKESGPKSNVSNEQVPSVNPTVIYNDRPPKEISRIIIYYNDNSFEEFVPDKINKG